jgi:type I restriction enzyme S subunit
MSWTNTTLGSLCGTRGKSLDPSKHPEETFELYSVPSHPTGRPEMVSGLSVGSTKQLVEPRSVLLCKINPRINRSWVVGSFSDFKKIASTEWLVFPPSQEILPEFLCYYLQQEEIRRYLAHNASGVGGSLMRVKASTLSGLPFSYPSDAEQQRIVAEIEKQFTRLEAGLQGLRRVQANLKRYRAAVLKAACEGKLVPNEVELAKAEGRTVETGAELLERILAERRKNWTGRGKYKEPATPDTSKLQALPAGWTWATMPQLGELNRGKSKHRPRDDERLYGGPYPFIQTGDVRKSGGRIREFTQTYSDFGLKQSRLWPAGTLCITIAANIAETGILAIDACFPDSVVGFISAENQVTTRYIEFFIRTAKDGLERFAPATAQKNINLEVLQNVCIPFPPLAEQTRIVAELDRRFSVIEEIEAVLTTNLQRATRLRQSILQRAFAGELV